MDLGLRQLGLHKIGVRHRFLAKGARPENSVIHVVMSACEVWHLLLGNGA
jgi:hypothetical protein